jgi:DNA-directed RNA polymerase subunit L/DNA-directed RNA polymerase alpha subunit
MDKIKKIDYKIKDFDSDYGNTRLEINIKGPNINHVIVNTIRRTIFTDIPIYAFTNFNFKKNNSIFNNNYIKLRINNLPVWGIKNNKSILENKKTIIPESFDEDEEEPENNDDIDMNEDTTKDLNSSTLNQLTMYVDYTNNENNIVTITTNHAKFYFGEKSIDNPYKIDIPLIKLQPKQTITFSAITTLDIEKKSSIYSPVSVCFYKQISPNEFDFILESKGQLDEKKIINVAILNILNKIQNISQLVPEEQKGHTGEIIILNEDNTLGNLLTDAMQQHKNVKFAGYNLPHLLDTKVIIHYELENEKIKLKDVMEDVIEYYTKLFNELLSLNDSIKLK